MPQIDLLDALPKTRRNVAAPRSASAENRAAARRYGPEYFDGNREQGYGGYRYDGRWQPVARRIATHYGLRPGDRVLDVGCAKGFLARDLAAAVPGLIVVGLDISEYALRNGHTDMHGRLVRGSADQLPFADGSFACVLAINVLHNLERMACQQGLRELARVVNHPQHIYVQVDAYRDETERALFENWVLTAHTYGTPDFWLALFAETGYQGDYNWTVIEADPAWTELPANLAADTGTTKGD
jgi:SAM-dependent methyltransferase